MDEVREEERERQHALYTELSEIQDELSKRDDAYTTVQLALERMVTRREAKGAELSELVTKRSSIEVELQETEAAARASGTESAKLSEQLQEVLRQVQKRERELRAIEPEHAAKTAQLAEMEAEVMAVRSQVETLYGKQGRGAQFNSKADRDRFLQTQIDSLSAQIEQKTALLQRTNREVEAEEQRLRGEQEQVDLAELQHRARLERYEEIGTLIRERTIYRNELQEQRKSGWRELEKYQEQIQEARQELEKGKQQLNRALPRHITQGLAAVEEIVQQKGITGYLGPLIDNITLRSAGLRNAVEVAAGNALFHVIVDTDTTAAFLIKELDRLKAGRLTFLPLNRLHNPHIRYPDSNDVRPLMSAALEYEASVEIAVKQVTFLSLFSLICFLDSIFPCDLN